MTNLHLNSTSTFSCLLDDASVSMYFFVYFLYTYNLLKFIPRIGIVTYHTFLDILHLVLTLYL